MRFVSQSYIFQSNAASTVVTIPTGLQSRLVKGAKSR